MKQFKAEPLPYTMGNTGDLIKHGLLCEFLSWLSNRSTDKLSFYDPFGGRPWQSPIDSTVKKRLAELPSCTLKKAQYDWQNRYFGSSQIVHNLSSISKRNISVFTSDRDIEARDDLHNSGLKLIQGDEYNPDHAYSILDCQCSMEKNHIILIDPFYDLQHINAIVLKKIIQRVTDSAVAVVLFVLYGPNDSLWQEFQSLNRQLTHKKVHCYSLSCQPSHESPVMGESKYHASVLLYLNRSFSQCQLTDLTVSLAEFAKNLTDVINAQISFSNHIAALSV